MLLGVFLGAAMTPLFSYTPALIILLGLTTYAAVLFVKANYTLFTFFITGWVFVVRIGRNDTFIQTLRLSDY